MVRRITFPHTVSMILSFYFLKLNLSEEQLQEHEGKNARHLPVVRLIRERLNVLSIFMCTFLVEQKVMSQNC